MRRVFDQDLLNQREYIDETVALCAELVQAQSENPPGNEAEAASVLARYFDGLGAEIDLTDVVPGRPNLVVRFPGDGGAPGLAFSGHLDVVPVGPEEHGRWFQKPYGAEIYQGEIFGRGSADMKGGLAAAAVAISTLRRADVNLPGDLWLLASVDEELEMLGIKKMVEDGILVEGNVGAAIVCEPTNLRIAYACKGRTWANIRVRGKTAHASLRGAGVNAIEQAVKLARNLEGTVPRHELHELAGDSWWTVTEINGGVGPAIIPDRCDMTLDVRLVPGQTCADVWNQVREIIGDLEAEEPEFSCELSVVEEREPWDTEPTNRVIAAMASGILNATGKEAELFAFPGTTDATYLVPAGIPCAICGPGDISRAHRENEGVEISELGAAAHAYMISIDEYFTSLKD
jgi:succinyl-diaminopimelate desuccinylase